MVFFCLIYNLHETKENIICTKDDNESQYIYIWTSGDEEQSEFCAVSDCTHMLVVWLT